MKNIFSLLLIALTMISCGSEQYANEDKESYEGTEEMSAKQTSSANTSNNDVQTTDRKLIKRADISLNCEDNQKHQTILDGINLMNGFISNSSQNDHTGKMTVRITAKIPAELYKDFMTILKKGDGTIEYINESVNDVTSHYIDLKARIDNKKEFELAYRKLLDSAKSVSDMLEIQREIEVLRSDIESYEQQFKYLSSQVSYSTFEIKLTYPSEIEQEEKDYSALIGLLCIALISIIIIVVRYNRKKKSA